MTDVVIWRLHDGAALDVLAEPYRHLHEAQTAVAPQLAHMPERTAEASWERRRAAYEQWLAAPDAFVALAQRDVEIIGFAVVTFAGAYHGWESGSRVGELKDLAVAPDERGRGIGSTLLDAVEDELARLGVAEYRVNVIAPNEDAARLYQRRGMTRVTSVFLARVANRRD
ncbi:GNAT family N-acetyltransferase [Solirubrobacter taibaiensis]|nr:GNAT family N-acetyltransferase [Solirubrobacter taibaiensis]